VCAFSSTTFAQKNKPKAGSVKLVFNNVVNNKPITLFDSSYSNTFGESYYINKLKYYISNTSFYYRGKSIRQKNTYHLINQAIESSLTFSVTLSENKYDSLTFLLGVDSAKNTSGAQAGALDPLNDMFWTWRSGYIMAKFDGTSPQSTVVNNKVEYHLGGFAGINSVLNVITLRFDEGKMLEVKKGASATLIINANIDRLWNAGSQIKIAEIPICTSPGPLAKKIADNFSKLFSVNEIIYNK
jgi:hypothetical protein